MTKDDLVFWFALVGLVVSNVAFILWLLLL